MTDSTHVTYGASAFVHNPTYQISRAQPAHHFLRASEVVHQPRPGGRGSPPLRAICIFRVAAFDVGAQPAHHFLRAYRGCPSSQPREGVEALPYGVVVKCKQQTRIVRRHAQRTRKKGRSEDRSFLCAEMPAGISVFTLCLPVSRRRPGRGCRGGRRQSGRRAGTSRLWA